MSLSPTLHHYHKEMKGIAKEIKDYVYKRSILILLLLLYIYGITIVYLYNQNYLMLPIENHINTHTGTSLPTVTLSMETMMKVLFLNSLQRSFSQGFKIYI